MGSVSFYLPDHLTPAARRALDDASLAGGYDLAPVPTQRRVVGNQLILSREANESGHLMLPWPLEGLGAPMSLSATLREREEPYHLLVELARGKLNQVRTQTADWKSIGLTLEPDDRRELDDLFRAFGRIAVEQTDPAASPAAEAVLARSYRLADRVVRLFTEQLLQTRLCESGRLNTALGCRLSRLPSPDEQARFTETFTAVRLVPDWRAIEPTESGYEWADFDELLDWALAANLQVSIGPIIDPDHGRFPDWLEQWHGDLPSLAAFMCDFTETLIRRYQRKVQHWQVFAGLNQAEVLGLGEDDRIRLAARLLDSARQTNPDAAWVIGLAQPWGDYLANETASYSPLVFADTLLRAGYALAGLEVELLGGTGPRASWPRDSLETVRILELFSVLGLPLEVTIGTNGEASPPGWAESACGLALALPHVQGVYWEAWSDADRARLSGVELIGRSEMRAVLRDLRQRALA
jgi:hypothetical protein